jgi:predicted RNA-binding Zn-ribbon protein involved in translation (DUF1610 family)
MIRVDDQLATPEQQVRDQAEAAFHAGLTHVRADAANGPYTCPRCGSRSLRTRGNYDLCPNCDWEDDGQDDHDSHLIRLGPNGGLSLDAAREVYRRTRGTLHPVRPRRASHRRRATPQAEGPARMKSWCFYRSGSHSWSISGDQYTGTLPAGRTRRAAPLTHRSASPGPGAVSYGDVGSRGA